MNKYITIEVLKNLHEINDGYFTLLDSWDDVLNYFRDRHKLRGFPTQKVAGDYGFEIYVPGADPAALPFKRLSYFTQHFRDYYGALEACVKELIKLKKEGYGI